ncbi:cob(I)yrinic acid a,c-diamide adenosyltransferase [Desulfopila aestuarii]|uniref:corrinoid adenosyltransferase n=1 Tax=Desulfopila aestuarii DSM 18488 TaxID=1121416 RepID=A0A1M7Y180_9BACT|nr:cob(I)yrinic acid a,c-diamide adenosyltransferase [Desulfopila aestuarii]SHO45426.1 cob(I)yrinic acid a,c-diamide adenosyltransferase [Desulfopila aestuarii DSM 18488]
MESKGILAIHTGNGKGKTTAALGLAFRALGHGQKVAIVQFIKGRKSTGENKLADQFPQLLEFHVTGRGFTWNSADPSQDIARAREAWELAQSIITEGTVNLLVLDELTYLVKYKMVAEEEILQALEKRPPHMHVVITGRDASERLIANADLVTEMKDIKHPYRQGISAQQGFDY